MKTREATLQKIKSQTLTREMSIERRDGAIDEEARTIEIALSSETPYERWGLTEILGHDAGEAMLDRLNNSAAFLEMHDLREQIGVVAPGTARIDKDKVLRCTVRFAKTAKAEEVWQMVLDGIRTKISVGYRVLRIEWETDEKGRETDTYRATLWEPLEASSVSVPADDTVGVGRSIEVQAGEDGSPDQSTAAAAAPQEKPPMKSHEHMGGGATDNAANEPTPKIEVSRESIEQEVRQKELERVREISACKERYPQHAKMCDEAMEKGASVPEFHASLIRAIATNPVPTDVVGMSKKEQREYSLQRACLALFVPEARGESSLELEISQTLARKLGKPAMGMYLPGDLGLRDHMMDYAKRTLTAGTATDGAELVATDHHAELFIDVLRNIPLVQRMGARVFTGLVGDFSVPRKSSAASITWKSSEGADAANSELQLETMSMTPKTGACYTDVTRDLVLQSAPGIEQLVRDDLSQAIALGVDAAAINGSGASGQPEGILNMTGIGDVAMGAAGDEPTWAKLIANIQQVAQDNALIGNLGWLINTKTMAIMAATDKGTDTGRDLFDMNSIDASGVMGKLAGYKCGISNQVPSNLVKGGSGAVCSALIFGNWADLFIGQWGAVDIMVDPYTLSLKGSKRIIAHISVDVGARHVESFSAIQDALTVIT